MSSDRVKSRPAEFATKNEEPGHAPPVVHEAVNWLKVCLHKHGWATSTKAKDLLVTALTRLKLSADTAEHDAVVEYTKRRHYIEGELEIDDDAYVSVGADGGGAYVQAWVWVDKGDFEHQTGEDWPYPIDEEEGT